MTIGIVNHKRTFPPLTIPFSFQNAQSIQLLRVSRKYIAFPTRLYQNWATMKILLVSLLVSAISPMAFGQSTDPYNQAPGAETFFSTFSIVAYDPATQEL